MSYDRYTSHVDFIQAVDNILSLITQLYALRRRKASYEEMNSKWNELSSYGTEALEFVDDHNKKASMMMDKIMVYMDELHPRTKASNTGE